MAAKYCESQLYQNVMQELDNVYEHIPDVSNKNAEAVDYVTPFLYQVSRSVVEKAFFLHKNHNPSVMIDR